MNTGRVVDIQRPAVLTFTEPGDTRPPAVFEVRVTLAVRDALATLAPDLDAEQRSTVLAAVAPATDALARSLWAEVEKRRRA